MEKIPLIPSTPEEMSEMLQLCSYVRFKVPQQVMWSPQQDACLYQRLSWQVPASFMHSLFLVLLCIHSTSIYTVPMMCHALCLGTVVNK